MKQFIILSLITFHFSLIQAQTLTTPGAVNITPQYMPFTAASVDITHLKVTIREAETDIPFTITSINPAYAPQSRAYFVECRDKDGHYTAFKFEQIGGVIVKFVRLTEKYLDDWVLFK